MEFKLFQPQYIHELGKRKNQEDSLYPNDGQATPENRVFIVCDGMGGHDKGEVASAAVCQGLSRKAEALLSSDRPFSDDDFRAALSEAYANLDAADTERAGRMGTTMTFICLHRGGCLAAHIGDSRIYHLRPQTGEVLYRSRDHSLVQQLYELGEISYDGMATSPRKNVILRAMQPLQTERSEPALVHITDVRPGDYFYLCSDGMLERMEDDQLLSIVGDDSLTEEQKVERLIAETADNSDNHTAYLVKLAEVTNEAGDEAYPNDEPEARRRNKALNDPRKSEVWDYNPNGVPHATTAPQPADDESTQFVAPRPAAAPPSAMPMPSADADADRTSFPTLDANRPSFARPDATPTSFTPPPPAAKGSWLSDKKHQLIVALAALGVLAVLLLLLLLPGKSAATDEDDTDDNMEIITRTPSPGQRDDRSGDVGGAGSSMTKQEKGQGQPGTEQTYEEQGDQRLSEETQKADLNGDKGESD